MHSPKAPQPPDPRVVAQAGADANKATAVAQFGLNATNQVTPSGSLTYRQVGTWPDGTPRFEAATSLNPSEQQVYNTDVANRQRVGEIGGQQIEKLGSLLGTPVNLTNAATEGRLMELGRRRLDPMFAERNAALETDLMNRGIRPGGDAYAPAHRVAGQNENDAYNQLLLTGRGQSVQEALTERNQPINEITALQSGSQVSQPNFTSTPQPGIAPVDVAGIYNNNFAQQTQQYQAKMAQQNAMMGGIAGIAAAPLGGWAMRGFGAPQFR